ncbi:hypothetical protein [Nostoc sp.]|uniref:hypothetical protein n=1 Tax=Nostoc sp. TaxID=1180 RepID=UPI002FF63EE5
MSSKLTGAFLKPPGYACQTTTSSTFAVFCNLSPQQLLGLGHSCRAVADELPGAAYR